MEKEINYNGLIETILNSLSIDYKFTGNYYVCCNPIITENNPSMQIFSNGWVVSYNGYINGKNRIPLKEFCILLGRLDLFIEYICLVEKIPSYKVNRYRELLLQDKFNFKDIKEKKELQQLFSKYYIGKSDIIGISYVKHSNPKKFESKAIKKKSEISEIEISEEERQQVIDYMESRSLEVLDGLCEPIAILTNNKYKSLAIGIRYKCGYMKCRLINSDIRYLTITEKGDYTEFYEAYIDDKNDKCIIGEGELNTVCARLSNVNEFDILAMSNCNSTPLHTTQLHKYKEVYVIVDFDKYEKIKDGLKEKILKLCNKDTKVIVTYTNKENLDFNDLLVKYGKTYLKEFILNKIKIMLDTNK